MKKYLVLVLLLLSNLAMALPIDWSGTFSTDFSRIVNYNRSEDPSVAGAGASQVIGTSGDNLAIFQNYILKLNPTIIVNDSVSIFGSLSTGQNQGGFYGDDTSLSNDTTKPNTGLVTSTRNAGNNGLNVNLIYAELYTDTALYRVGRFTKHWGMGAVFNSGKKSFDRFHSLFDGFEAELNFGKVILTPYYAKFNTETLTRDSDYSEMGVSVLYDNPDKNMQAGLLYTSRSAGSANTLIKDGTAVTALNQGAISLNIIDIFLRKEFGKFSIEVEIPMMSGDAGDVYGAAVAEDQTYQSTSALVDVKYEHNKKWLFGFLGGMVKGDDASTNDFGATYLHPNFQVAELMFRYNLESIAGTGKGATLYDSNITNARFLKLYSSYYTNNWTLNFAVIMATADQVAGNGGPAWNHTTQIYSATTTGTQEKDMGMEFDFSFDYNWNTSTVFTSYFGYHKVGAYYEYNDAGAVLEIANSYTVGARLEIDF